MLSRSISFVAIALAFQSLSFAQTVEAPISGVERAHWLLKENLGVGAILQDLAIAGESTLTNTPKEYGPHWEGYGKRVGIVAANYGVKSTMEAGFGSLWGEDPRYRRTEGEAFANRLGHVFKMTFMARNRAGETVPAYARYIAIPGSNFLANTWMPDSESKLSDAALRTGLGFLSRMGENAYKEFIARH